VRVELDVDALSDGTDVIVGRASCSTIEEAGRAHPGDSACSLPPYSLSREDHRQRSKKQTKGNWRWRERCGPDEHPVWRFTGWRNLPDEVNPACLAHRPFLFARRTDSGGLRPIRGADHGGEKLSAFPCVHPTVMMPLMTTYCLGTIRYAGRSEHALVSRSKKAAVLPFARFSPASDNALGPRNCSPLAKSAGTATFPRAFLKARWWPAPAASGRAVFFLGQGIWTSQRRC